MSFIDELQLERIQFVDKWAEYVCNHDDKDWSHQQNIIINSCLKNATFTKEEYLLMKNEGKKVII